MGFYGILDVDGFDPFLPTRNDILENGGGVHQRWEHWIPVWSSKCEIHGHQGLGPYLADDGYSRYSRYS